MLGRILGLNSNVCTFGELHFFEQLVDAEEFSRNAVWSRERSQSVLGTLLTRARDGFFSELQPGRYDSDVKKILEDSPSLRPADLYASFMVSEATSDNARIPCEQTPRYLFAAREILEAYSDARIVHLIRDPRDVLLSQKSKWKRRFLGGSSIPVVEAIRAWCNYHPWLVSRLWVSCVDYADAIDEDRFLSLRFEDLLANPESEIRNICDFLGIAFENDMLNVPRIGSSTGRDFPTGKGIDKSRGGGWMKSGMRSTPRLVCEWVCGDRMRAHGYANYLKDGRFSPYILLSMLTLPLKLLLAAPFNVNRFSRLTTSLKRRLAV